MVRMPGVIVGIVSMLGLTVALSAHHSFAAFYFEDQMIQIEGEIVQIQFVAPHTWIHVKGQDASGKERVYGAEWANPSRLEREGMTRDTLKLSDVVRIWGSPSRDPNDNRLHLKRILRPSDGWEWKMPRRTTR